MKKSVKSYKKGEFIFLEDEAVQNVGIVLSGRVHLLKEDIWGNQTLIAYSNEGDLFGESFALRKRTNSYATFMAAKDTQVLFLSFEHLLHPCANQCSFHLAITQNMYDLMGEKNVKLMERIEIASKSTLRGKILAYLSLQAQTQRAKYFTVPLNRNEMASYLQSNRSAMSRELSNMKADKLIDFDGNTFTILK